MAEVPASVVVKLRKMSGQGMMDCKKALEESNGDMDKAMEILRKKGLATLARRAERETTEGAVVAWQSQDGKEAALATLCCETDFVAKSDDFVQLARDIRDYIGSAPGTQGAETRPANHPRREKRSRKCSRKSSAERARRCRSATTPASGWTERGSSAPTFTSTIKSAAWSRSRPATPRSHRPRRSSRRPRISPCISRPASPSPWTWPASILRWSSGKKRSTPPKCRTSRPRSWTSIVEGKLKKFYSDYCLLEQPFVKDDTKTVKQMLAEAAKQAGGQATVKQFVRFEVG